MFKAPEWEDDVPKTNTSFLKKSQINQKGFTESKDKPSLKVRTNKPKQKNLNKASEAKTKPLLKVNKLKLINSKKYKPKESPSQKAHKWKENKSLNVKTDVSSNSQAHEKNISKKSRKRKLETKSVDVNSKKNIQSIEPQIPESQNFDEILLNAKKKKFNEVIENEDKEHLLFTENKPKNKKRKNNISVNDIDIPNDNKNSVNNSPINTKKQRLKALLDNQRTRSYINVNDKSNTLRQRMLERLKAAQFRYLNEKLYTSSGSETQQLFKEDPAAFETYHQGYQLQVKKWPVNPLDVIVKKITKMPKSHLIADMGCGEAALSRRVPHTVRSFDLVATVPGVEACDMARTPLLAASMDVVVYCLALMGTNLTQYLVEANRVLKVGGHLLIAEVESRFDNVENFTKEVQRLGFKLKQLNQENKVFYFMEFTKAQNPPVKKAKLPVLTLRPCIYKRR